MKKLQKGRPKPKDQERLISIKGQKRLASQKAKEEKEATRSAVLMRILGGVMLAGTIYIWLSRYKVVPMSGLAIVGGLALTGIFKVVYPSGLDSSNKTQKLVFLILIGIMMSLMINRSTFGFAIIFFFSLISSVYLFGIVKSFPDSKA